MTEFAHVLGLLEKTGHAGAVGGSFVGAYVGLRVLHLLDRLHRGTAGLRSSIDDLAAQVGRLTTRHEQLRGEHEGLSERLGELEAEQSSRPRILRRAAPGASGAP